MKSKLLIAFISFTLTSQAQTIHLTKASFKPYKHGPQEIVADSTLAIANSVLNSQDFRDSLSALSFKNADNNCHCNNNIVLIDGLLKGQDAYNELFKISNPKIDLIFKKGSPTGGLGVTPVCTNTITSFVEAAKHNMSNLPVSSALAVNICHEYFHSLGYCHTYDTLVESDRRPNGDAINWKVYNEDITYRIGWIAYDILNRWINTEHRKFPYDKP